MGSVVSVHLFKVAGGQAARVALKVDDDSSDDGMRRAKIAKI